MGMFIPKFDNPYELYLSKLCLFASLVKMDHIYKNVWKNKIIQIIFFLLIVKYISLVYIFMDFFCAP